MSYPTKMVCEVIRQEFDWLVSEHGFAAKEETSEGVASATVDYASPKVTISPGWNERDGFEVGIYVKVDTFWIRPASSHMFDLRELLALVAPAVKYEVPASLSGCYAEPTEADLRRMLAFCAGHLRTFAQPLLREDVSLCEDMLITRGW